MGKGDDLAAAYRGTAVLWRRLAADALSDDERWDCDFFARLYDQRAREIERARGQRPRVLGAAR